MINLDGAQLLQQWDLFRMETDHSNQQSGFHFTSKRGGNWLLFWRGLSVVTTFWNQLRGAQQSAKKQNVHVLIDLVARWLWSTPTSAHHAPKSIPKSIPKRQHAKIEPKKAQSAPKSAHHTPRTKTEPKNGAPHTKNDPKKAHRAPKSAPKSAHHTPHTKIEPKNGAPRTKIEPKIDAPCTEISPKIGAPHTAHQNPAQKRRTVHQNRARKRAPRTKIHPKGHHAPGPRPHIRQVSGSIPPRSSPILRAHKGAPCTEIGSKIGAPHTAHQNRAQKRRTAHQNRAQKRRTVHRNRPQNRRTTYHAPKSSPKTAHRAPKSSPKTAHRTEIGPKIGAPHTAHQNPAQKRRTAHQNRAQKRRTAHQNRARKRAPRTKIHPKGHHAPGPRPHIRQVSGSIPPTSSPILIDLVARWLWSTPTSAHHAPKSIPKRQRAKIEPKKAHRAPKSAPRSALHTPCTKMEPKNGGPHAKNDPKKAHRAPKKAPHRALCTQTKSTTETTHRWQLVPRPPPDPWKIF